MIKRILHDLTPILLAGLALFFGGIILVWLMLSFIGWDFLSLWPGDWVPGVRAFTVGWFCAIACMTCKQISNGGRHGLLD